MITVTLKIGHLLKFLNTVQNKLPNETNEDKEVFKCVVRWRKMLGNEDQNHIIIAYTGYHDIEELIRDGGDPCCSACNTEHSI
jgi:hypothetical protein